jgi:hypothetical protein
MWLQISSILVQTRLTSRRFVAGGIGRQVAIDLARNGYAVVVAGKTTSDASKCVPFPPDPNSQKSTINTVVGAPSMEC